MTNIRGGNLTRPAHKLLFNTINQNKVKSYSEGKFGVYGLFFVEHGIFIPGNSALTAGSMDAGMKAIKTVGTAGTKGVKFVTLNAPEPAEDTNYSVGLNIRKVPRHTGATDQYMPTARYYDAFIKKLGTASGGEIAAADKITVLNQFSQAIYKDRKEADVTACVRWKVSDDTIGDTSTVVVTINGTAITITETGVHTVADFVATINALATVNTHILAIAIDTQYFYIRTIAGAGTVSVADGTTTTVTEPGLELTNMYTKNNVKLEYEEGFVTEAVVTAHVFPLLYNDDIQREFSVKSYQEGTVVEQPLSDTVYSKYTFIWDTDKHPGLAGASSSETRYQEVQVYVPEAIADLGDYWDVDNYMVDTDDSTFTGDATWEEFLEDVMGTDPAAWLETP